MSEWCLILIKRFCLWFVEVIDLWVFLQNNYYSVEKRGSDYLIGLISIA